MSSHSDKPDAICHRQVDAVAFKIIISSSHGTVGLTVCQRQGQAAQTRKKTLNFSKGVRKKFIFFLNMPEFQAFTSRLSAFI